MLIFCEAALKQCFVKRVIQMTFNCFLIDTSIDSCSSCISMFSHKSCVGLYCCVWFFKFFVSFKFNILLNGVHFNSDFSLWNEKDESQFLCVASHSVVCICGNLALHLYPILSHSMFYPPHFQYNYLLFCDTQWLGYPAFGLISTQGRSGVSGEDLASWYERSMLLGR